MPTLNEFLSAARPANPGVSDEDLTSYYQSKYGGQVQQRPGFDEWMTAARRANPGTADADLSSYYTEHYGQPEQAKQGDMAAGWGAGVESMKSLFYGFLGATGQAIGSNDLRDWGVAGMMEHDAKAQEAGRGHITSTSQVENVDDAIDWAQYTLGQLAPFALESVASMLAGMAVGSTVPGAGTVTGGIAGLAGKQGLKKLIMQYAKGELKDEAEKQLARSALKKSWGTIGSAVGTYPVAVGDVYNETNEAGKPSAGAAFGLGVPYAALDVIADRVGLGRLLGEGKGGLLARAGKGAVAQSPIEGATEYGQEEILIQARAALDPAYDPTGPEANQRRIDSAAAGALGGGVMGVATGAMQTRADDVTNAPSIDDAIKRANEIAGGPVDTSNVERATYARQAEQVFNALGDVRAREEEFQRRRQAATEVRDQLDRQALADEMDRVARVREQEDFNAEAAGIASDIEAEGAALRTWPQPQDKTADIEAAYAERDAANAWPESARYDQATAKNDLRYLAARVRRNAPAVKEGVERAHVRRINEQAGGVANTQLRDQLAAEMARLTPAPQPTQTTQQSTITATQPPAVQPSATAQSTQTATQQAMPDRRTDIERRKRIDEMTPEEMRRELLVDDMTGLGNRRAYEESAPAPVEASVDADSLKWINDNMTHDSGDQMLRAIGKALEEEGVGDAYRAFHLSGDEFAVKHSDRGELAAALDRASERLKDAVIRVQLPDGNIIEKHGVEFTYGIGTTKQEADLSLRERKAQREASGERAARGEQPPGVARIAPERQQDSGSAPAAEKKVARKRARKPKTVTQTAKLSEETQDLARRYRKARDSGNQSGEEMLFHKFLGSVKKDAIWVTPEQARAYLGDEDALPSREVYADSQAAQGLSMFDQGAALDAVPEGEFTPPLSRAEPDMVPAFTKRERGLIPMRRMNDMRHALKGERGIIARAVQTLLDAGMPQSMLDGLTLIGVAARGGSKAYYHPDMKAITVHESVLEALQENPDSVELQELLAQYMAHELSHHLDNGGGNDSWAVASPLFDMEVEAWEEGGDARGSFGEVMDEAIRAWTEDKANLGRFFDYPLSHVGRELNEGGDMSIIKAEVFAQIGALYWTRPAILREHMPKAYGMMEEIHADLQNVAETGGAVQRRDAVRQALRAPAAPGRVAGWLGASPDEAGAGNGRPRGAVDGRAGRDRAGVGHRPAGVAATYEKENVTGVVVGGRPGKFDWSPGKTDAPPFAVPSKPRIEKVGPAILDALRSREVAALARDAFGIESLAVEPVHGSWLGELEPSFALTAPGMTYEQAVNLANMLGVAFTQEAVVVSQPYHAGDADAIQAVYAGGDKHMTEQQIAAIMKAAQEEGLDFTTTVDNRGVKFLYFGEDADIDSFMGAAARIAAAADLPEIVRLNIRSELRDAETYLENPTVDSSVGGERGGGAAWHQDRTTGPSDLFRRAVDHLLIPYAEAVGSEGYALSAERLGQRFGLSRGQVAYIADALRSAGLDEAHALSMASAFSGARPRRAVNTRTDLDAEQEAALGKIDPQATPLPIRERVAKAREGMLARIHQGLVDQYSSLKKLGEHVWMLARMTPSATGALESMLVNGKVRLTDDGALTVDTVGEGLNKALQPLGEELDYFLAWIAGNRAAKLAKQGREHLFTDSQIAALVRLNQGTMHDGRDRAAVYQQALNDFNAFHRSVLDVAEKAGLFNAGQRAEWEDDFYVPFYRFTGEDSNARGPSNIDSLVKQSAFKKLKGADMPLRDLLQNTLMNWNHLLSASLRNQAGVEALEAAEAMGIASKVPREMHSKSAVWVNKDGVKTWYEVEDPMILESLSALSYNGMNNGAMRAMRAFKRAFTLGVTADPQFRIANLLRDSIHALAVSDLKKNPVANVITGFKDTRRDALAHARMLAGGGEMHFGHLYGADPEAARLLVKKGIKDDTILNNKKAFGHLNTALKVVWDSWGEFGSRLENVNRAALYSQLKAQGASELEANFGARDMMDFSAHGAWPAARFLVQVVPFLNARIQGLDKMGRALADPKQRRQFAAVTATVALASMALYLAYRDDDDFKDREEWDRDTYWWFKLPGSDTAFRIPKPFEVGAIGTLAERMLEQIVDDEAHGELFAERLWHMLTQTFSFSPVPQMAQPFLDIYANKNPFTGRPIESMGLERLSKNQRKNAWTSETAVGIARAYNAIAWESVEMSPVQVEYLVKGYLGWIGGSILGTTDMFVSRPVSGAPARPAWKLQDWPVIGRFVREHPERNTKSMTLFYDTLNEIRTVYADVRNYKKFGEDEAAMELAAENKDLLAWRKRFERVSRQLTELNDRIKLLYANKSMDADQKRAELDRLTQLRNRAAKAITSRYEAGR